MVAPTGDEIRALLRRVAGQSVVSANAHGSWDGVDWQGLPVRVTLRGTEIGKLVLILATDLANYVDVVERVPIAKLLEHIASNASVRMVVYEGVVALESSVVWDEVDPAHADDVVRWRLAELFSVASAWRSRLGLVTNEPKAQPVASLAEIKSEVRLSPEHALLVAAVAFGVAGADGVISAFERDKLKAWFSDVPAFAGLEPSRVVRSIALMVSDPTKALLETARKLDPRGRLLAWALANDMAHADGFASEDARRYLANMATVFKLRSEDLAPLVAEAQERAVRRETLEPEPHS